MQRNATLQRSTSWPEWTGARLRLTTYSKLGSLTTLRHGVNFLRSHRPGGSLACGRRPDQTLHREYYPYSDSCCLHPALSTDVEFSGTGVAPAFGETGVSPVGGGRVRAVIVILLAFVIFALPAEAQKDLAKRIDARLAVAPYNRPIWGITIHDESGRLVYGRNQDRLFIPASSLKLVVAAAAAVLFPPDWTVKTSLYGTGPTTAGVLQGDLILYGRGDPTFSRRCYGVDTAVVGACEPDPALRLRQLVDTLHAHGVRSVTGDIVGDGSYFEPMLVHPAWERYDLNWWYAAPVSGLAFNDNSIDIQYGPGPSTGAPASITFTPNFGDVTIDNRTRTSPSGSDDTIDFFREPGTLRIWAEGQVSRSSRAPIQYFALPDPNLYAARALRTLLAEAGIAVAGATRSTTDSTEYRHVRLTPALAEVSSRPVRDWIFPVLNTSQNWFAEMLLKQLGKEFGTAGSWAEGLRIERRFLIDSVGIDSTHFSLSDGSGLATVNLMTPVAMTRLLRYMRRHPRWEVFAAGLPQAGRAGSLRTRFINTPLAGRVRAKTGSIARVGSLSGYLQRPDGQWLTFSVQANHHAIATRAMAAAIDSLVVVIGTAKKQ